MTEITVELVREALANALARMEAARLVGGHEWQDAYEKVRHYREQLRDLEGVCHGKAAT